MADDFDLAEIIREWHGIKSSLGPRCVPWRKSPGQNAKPIYIGPKRGCFYHDSTFKIWSYYVFFLNVHVYYMQVNEMCIRICICRYVWICIYVFVSVNVLACVYDSIVYVHVYVDCICICVYMYITSSVHAYAYAYAYAYVYIFHCAMDDYITYTRTMFWPQHAHTQTHTHIYIYIHTYNIHREDHLVFMCLKTIWCTFSNAEILGI